MAERFEGHTPIKRGSHDWRCACGFLLSGGPFGDGRRGARDVMRFHRIDLRMERASANAHPETEADRGA